MNGSTGVCRKRDFFFMRANYRINSPGQAPRPTVTSRYALELAAAARSVAEARHGEPYRSSAVRTQEASRGRATSLRKESRRSARADAGQRALRDGEVSDVPEADVGHVARDNSLNLGVTAAAARSSSVDALGLVEQRVDLGIAVEAPIEADRRDLGRVKHAAEDVGIGQRALGPLQRVDLKIALDHVGVAASRTRRCGRRPPRRPAGGPAG